MKYQTCVFLNLLSAAVFVCYYCLMIINARPACNPCEGVLQYIKKERLSHVKTPDLNWIQTAGHTGGIPERIKG